MNILKYDILSESELLARLRKTRLKGFDQFPVYESATLEIIEHADISSLVPPQQYVLVPGIQTITDLVESFAKKGVDVFSLRGALMFWLEGSDPEKDKPIPFLPPVVEESFERDGQVIRLVNDGMHRVYTARKLGRSPNVVFVSNIPKDKPYYAYPLSGGWDNVEEIPELTDGYKKKEYRMPENYKALFRNFNEHFEGVQVQRKQTSPEELKLVL